MLCDALHKFDGMSDRVEALARQSAGARALRDGYRETLALRQREVEALTKRAEQLTLVGELFLMLMDQLVLGQVKSVEGVVTEGLKAIFQDQSLVLESEMSSRYNKVAIDFFLKQGEGGLAIRGKPLESFGGGPASVASLVLRIMTILKLKRWPVLFLDETLAAVSDEYVDQTGTFLHKLARSAKIDVLMVTHKQAYLEHADVAYQGSEEQMPDGSWSLGLRSVKK